MLDLAALRGLLPEVATIPTVVYFHENQLTYPQRSSTDQSGRDLHYAFTNLTTAACADRVWFNSEWHREQFLTAAAEWCRRMPDYPPVHLVDEISAKSELHPPGIDPMTAQAAQSGPLRIAWVSRWEYDKNPETFFAALRALRDRDIDFRLCVLGERYSEAPACFAQARAQFAEAIDHFGFVPEREEYRSLLATSDVVVSTAIHEFFGLAVVEAVSAGCLPVVPKALAYPEVLSGVPAVYHDNTAAGLADRLGEVALRILDGNRPDRHILSGSVNRYAWPEVAPSLDSNILLCPSNA